MFILIMPYIYCWFHIGHISSSNWKELKLSNTIYILAWYWYFYCIVLFCRFFINVYICVDIGFAYKKPSLLFSGVLFLWWKYWIQRCTLFLFYTKMFALTFMYTWHFYVCSFSVYIIILLRLMHKLLSTVM